MVLAILAKLAVFSLKKPKTVAIVVASLAILMFGIHYKLLIGERDKFRVAEAGYRRAVAAFVLRESVLREDARIAAEATVRLTEQRNANISALSALRSLREMDEEGRTWGTQPIPLGEISRLCTALPEMEGCSE